MASSNVFIPRCLATSLKKRRPFAATIADYSSHSCSCLYLSSARTCEISIVLYSL